MKTYYISRILLSILFAAALALFGMPWWTAVLIGLLLIGLFIWAPRSGRYLVRPENGVTALRRDERTQAINLRAGLNGFVGLMLALGGLAIYYGVLNKSEVPASMLSLLIGLGVVIYFITDFWMRKA